MFKYIERHSKKYGAERHGDFFLVKHYDDEFPYKTIRMRGGKPVSRVHKSREHALKFIEVAQKLTK